MDKELIREIMASGSALLTTMASAAKTTGEHLYGVLVRQQMVEGISTLIAVPLWLFLTWFGLRWVWKKSIEIEVEVLSILGTLFWPIITLVLILFIQYSIQKLLNPEYFAIKFLIESVKK